MEVPEVMGRSGIAGFNRLDMSYTITRIYNVNAPFETALWDFYQNGSNAPKSFNVVHGGYNVTPISPITSGIGRIFPMNPMSISPYKLTDNSCRVQITFQGHVPGIIGIPPLSAGCRGDNIKYAIDKKYNSSNPTADNESGIGIQNEGVNRTLPEGTLLVKENVLYSGPIDYSVEYGIVYPTQLTPAPEGYFTYLYGGIGGYLRVCQEMIGATNEYHWNPVSIDYDPIEDSPTGTVPSNGFDTAYFLYKGCDAIDNRDGTFTLTHKFFRDFAKGVDDTEGKVRDMSKCQWWGAQPLSLADLTQKWNITTEKRLSSIQPIAGSSYNATTVPLFGDIFLQFRIPGAIVP